MRLYYFQTVRSGGSIRPTELMKLHCIACQFHQHPLQPHSVTEETTLNGKVTGDATVRLESVLDVAKASICNDGYNASALHFEHVVFNKVLTT